MIKSLIAAATVVLTLLIIAASADARGYDRQYQESLRMAVLFAQTQARAQVFETTINATQDNIPRYLANGRTAAYAILSKDDTGKTIGNPWCVSFTSFVWISVATYYGGGPMASILRPHRAITARMRSQQYPDGTHKYTPVRVREMWAWAQQTDRDRRVATPGYMVVYGPDHMGIVSKVNSKRQATYAIDGNTAKGSVEVRSVNHRRVTGYIAPLPGGPMD